MADENSKKSETQEHHVFEIEVNKNKIQISGPKTTGLKIKEAAIGQGVQIELDFQLAEVQKNGQHQIIGDNEIVNINKNSVFVATDSDDNS